MGWPSKCSAPDGWCQAGAGCSTVPYIDVPINRKVKSVVITISGTGHPVMSQLKFFTPGSAGGENKVRDAVDQLLA